MPQRAPARPRKQPAPPAAKPVDPVVVPTLEVSAVERPSDPHVAARIRELEERLDRDDRRARPQSRESDGEQRSRRSPCRRRVPARRRPRARLRAAGARPSSTPRASSSRPTSTSASGGASACATAPRRSTTSATTPSTSRGSCRSSTSSTRGTSASRCTASRTCPREGRCLLVANHSGTLPFDGMMLRLAVRREHPRTATCAGWPRTSSSTSRSSAASRTAIGAVRACQENAERLLRPGGARRRLPRGDQGNRQALQGALQAAALRARRLRQARACGRARPSCPSPSSAPRRRTRCSRASSTSRGRSASRTSP